MDEKKFPRRGELVIGTVSRVNPFSAFVKLEDYPGVEGMIHISEIARKWVKDIRDFVKEGKRIVVLVMRVDPVKGHVGLSLKRVSKRDVEEKLKEAKREQKAERMLEIAAKKRSMETRDAYEEVGHLMKERFGEMFKVFKLSMTEDGYRLLIKRGIPEEWAKTIREVAEETMEIKERELKGILELTCSKPDGIEVIKKVLKDAGEKGFIIKYISAPKYSISILSKEAKKDEKKLRAAAEDIIKAMKAGGGEGRFIYE
ncbi:MAG: translation initiation factor IF-2 subunit alpha [Candidatus Aenigmatarchaeota archaeon]